MSNDDQATKDQQQQQNNGGLIAGIVIVTLICSFLVMFIFYKFWLEKHLKQAGGFRGLGARIKNWGSNRGALSSYY